ncbi:MAG: lactate utilization protein [Pseudomonadota bacterium]
MSARDRILARLRAAPPGAPAPLPVLDPPPPPENRETLLARFRAHIEAAHAEVHDTDPANWPALLSRLMAQKGLYRLLVGQDSPHAARLAALGDAAPETVAYDRPVEFWRDELFAGIDAALTTARSAIAATGSLILWPDAREPRLMSLVPPVHFVLLAAEAIHADLRAAMLAERWAEAMPTNALVISGPSKTADIQQTLAYGAHGPRELVVLLCRQPGGQP